MITGDNNLFIRLWHEIQFETMGVRIHSREAAVQSKKKWFPYNKGGEYRKWYGNNEYVVNWENDGFTMRNHMDEKGKIAAHAFNLEYIFKENVTWNSLSSYKYAARYTDYGFLYDASGSFADVKGEYILYTLAFLCSEVAQFFLKAMNPTLNFQKGNISSLPFIIDENNLNLINELTDCNISLSKSDWDSFETSWDFAEHPLVKWSHDLWIALPLPPRWTTTTTVSAPKSPARWSCAICSGRASAMTALPSSKPMRKNSTASSLTSTACRTS